MEGKDLLREKVRIRDNHTCQLCNKVWIIGQRRFDVHHLDKDKEGAKGNVYQNNQCFDRMITLCHKCHLNLPHIFKKESIEKEIIMLKRLESLIRPMPEKTKRVHIKKQRVPLKKQKVKITNYPRIYQTPRTKKQLWFYPSDHKKLKDYSIKVKKTMSEVVREFILSLNKKYPPIKTPKCLHCNDNGCPVCENTKWNIKE